MYLFIDLLSTSSEIKFGFLLAALVILFCWKYFVASSNQIKSPENVKRTIVPKVALNPNEYQQFPLKEKIIVNHNTRIFRFALPSSTDVLGLPTGQHISVRAVIDGKEASRPYTPISSDEDHGHFDLLIKVYEKGAMSSHMDRLAIGDTVDVRGPKGKFNYVPNMFKNIGMLCGGTGITPMYQVIHAILRNPADKTKISLIFGNIAEEDILMRDELQALVDKHPEQFKLFFVLNKPPAGWTQGEGFITVDMIKQQFAEASSENKAVLCGPPVMNKAMTGHLTSLNYTEDSIFTF
ncbi:hypothetical protein SAMD00019534_086980 [Acytostelium subglobosum LB1]|uniref:hypothetical protein n=1 Tax=Acytostelium subglobosum LB1 TaxID=1410327 RepID=UPI000644E165|nr:hypothetical protein SAMD00019534_086980 [Acytostelium subglobosum LB1]GAM25523.1 hypothetical protein SAMD00019534_086980 [Acytostelium subglobosum LB1]|eukprot:XP_012751509.1 hypothetical protein SAMD00019534_086980 [Acytostelium subglobosum LB1]